MFKMFKRRVVLFVPDFWLMESNFKLYMDLPFTVIPYQSSKSNDKPFTVDSKGRMETVDIFNPK